MAVGLRWLLMWCWIAALLAVLPSVIDTGFASANAVSLVLTPESGDSPSVDGRLSGSDWQCSGGSIPVGGASVTGANGTATINRDGSLSGRFSVQGSAGESVLITVRADTACPGIVPVFIEAAAVFTFNGATATPSPTPTPTPASEPSVTLTAAATLTATARPTTPTSTPTPTPTPTPAASATPTPAPTPGLTTPPTDSLTVSLFATAPELDGRCDDTMYSDQATAKADLAGDPGEPVHVTLLHSGFDLFLCFDGISGERTNRVVVSVDSDNSRDGAPGPGDYRFAVALNGEASTGEGDGSAFVPRSVPEGDFQAAVSGSSHEVEVRISLEWLGGYGRIDSLSLSLEKDNGTPLGTWPQPSDPGSPSTWGTVVLAPLYPQTTGAGSLFLDGQSFLVVPYSSALNPGEITIEAWVKVVGGDCGTLVGNGQTVSYWLAVCRVLEFGENGNNTVRGAASPLGDGWHHVAATMNGEGVKTLYLDGEVDAQFGWKAAQEYPEGEPEPAASLGISDRMLRIGSDRDVLGDEGGLHAYVRELRIWDKARTGDEIHADAFKALTGQEPGLVGLWPLTQGLEDVAGGHDAGRIGNAALARAAPEVTAFPEPTATAATAYPKPGPPSAWDGVIPTIPPGTDVNLDGSCKPSEYEHSARLALEPDKAVLLSVMIKGGDALYVCTNILWGPTGGLTLLIDRSGAAGLAPGPDQLRLRITPDGILTQGTGDGTGFAGPPPEDIRFPVLTAQTYGLQEDIRTMNAPIWTGELRIPLSSLAPFVPGQPLRFAVLYEGTFPDGALSGQTRSVPLQQSWPADFDELVPDSWGVAQTGVPLPEEPAVVATSNALAMVVPTNTQSLAFPLPTSGPPSSDSLASTTPSPPTTSDFYASCPDIDIDWGDPSTWPKLITALGYAAFKNKKWPMVDPGGNPFVWVEGTLDSQEVSSSDSFLIHGSHDMDMYMYTGSWAKLAGQNEMVLETESGGIESRALPVPGDHVTVGGRWIFDCGHSPKTEIHPIPIIASDHAKSVPLWAGGPRRDIREMRIWMNSSPGAFKYTFSGPYQFTMQVSGLASAPGYQRSLPFIRVVEGDASRISWSLSGQTLTITVNPPASTGKWFWRIYVGTLGDSVYKAPLTTYGVKITNINVHDDHDDSFSRGDGDWYYLLRVNDFYSWLLWEGQMDDDDNPYGQSLLIPIVDGPLEFEVSAYENDSTDDTLPSFSDEKLSSGTWPEGQVSDWLGKTGKISTGDWDLEFTVVKLDASSTKNVVPIIESADVGFWKSILAEEPGGLDFGKVTVPQSGTASKTAFSHLTGRPLGESDVNLIDTDEDAFQLSVDDFADVTASTQSQYGDAVAKISPGVWGTPVCVPEEYKEVFPLWRQGVVSSASGKPGNLPYTLKVNVKAAVLAPDPGEGADSSGGRLVDLVNAPLIAEGTGQPHRNVTMPCAWQHVRGDIDYYHASFPPFQQASQFHIATQCDSLTTPSLRFDAPGMRVIAPALGLSGDDALKLSRDDLKGNLQLEIRVESKQGEDVPKRKFYRLTAKWTDAKYWSVDECAAFIKKLKEVPVQKVSLEILPIPDPDAFPPLGSGIGLTKVSLTQIGTWGLLQVSGASLTNETAPGPRSYSLVDLKLGGEGEAATANGSAVVALRGSLSLFVSSPADEPVSARIYDLDGVLLAESQALPPDMVGAIGSDGLTWQAILQVDELTPDGTYLIQYLPACGQSGQADIPVGLVSAQGWTSPGDGQFSNQGADCVFALAARASLSSEGVWFSWLFVAVGALTAAVLVIGGFFMWRRRTGRTA